MPTSVGDYLKDTVALAPASTSGRVRSRRYLPRQARTTKGVLRDLAYQYLTPITATNGQSGGFTVTDIVPKLRKNRPVLYVGDFELRGPADQIEENTRRYIESHTSRMFDGHWTKVALTTKQVKASPRLQRLSITKADKRNKPAKTYEAIECEALGQGVLVRLIRKHLDSLLPERLAVVQEREQEQRTKVSDELAKIAGGSS